MSHLTGIDLSLTCTGIATITAEGDRYQLETAHIRSAPIKSGVDVKGKPRETVLDRNHRLTDLTQRITRHGIGADLVVIEGLIPTGPVRGVQDIPALWWFVVSDLCAVGVPVAVISPTSMKHAIVGPRPKGSGTIDKVEVALAVRKLWPDSELGNSDTADASGLAHLGAVRLGWSVPTLERHRDVKFTEWPKFASDAIEVA